MNDMEMAANLYTLEDEDGVEQQFEMLDTLEVDGERYYALVPYYEDPTKELEADAELVVLKGNGGPVPGQCSESQHPAVDVGGVIDCRAVTAAPFRAGIADTDQ